MQQHHQMDVTVSGNGELSVKVHYRGGVPDLLSRFSDDIRQRATRFVWWKTRYERRLLKAARDMPDWAKATIRQHLLHERAVRIEARLQRQAERRQLKEQRRVVRIAAFHQLRNRLPRLQPSRSPSGGTPAAFLPGEVEPGLAIKDTPATVALPSREQAPPEKPASALTLTQQFAKDTTALAALPRPDLDRSRGR